jgi:small GTP-binding protein
MTENKPKKEILLYKVLIIGNSTVGKTSFLLRFCDGKFEPESLTTIGVDIKKKFIKRNDKNIQLNICDTAGQEKFRAIAKNYYKNVDGIIIMYDISSEKSFQDIKNWIDSITNNVDVSKIGLIIAGNKIDLTDKRQVNEDMRKSLEKKQNIKVIETSAKDNINVNEIFIELVDQMEKLGLGVLYHSSIDNENDDDEDGANGVKLKREKTKKNYKNEKNHNCCLRK